MGRIKRGYVREIPSDELKRDYRLFAIACEGSKREKEYFQQLEGISSRVVVEYIESGIREGSAFVATARSKESN